MADEVKPYDERTIEERAVQVPDRASNVGGQALYPAVSREAAGKTIEQMAVQQPDRNVYESQGEKVPSDRMGQMPSVTTDPYMDPKKSTVPGAAEEA